MALTRRTFVGKVMSLLFNMLPRLVIAFLLRSQRLLISWLQSPSAVILEPPKIKSLTVSPSICHKVVGPDAMILVFWMLSFKPAFWVSSFTFIKRHFSSSSLYAIRVMSSAYLKLLIFLLAILIPTCASSSPAFHQCTLRISRQYTALAYSFPYSEPVCCSISSFNSCFWPAYRFFRRQVRWSGIPISWRIFHSLLWSTQSKALA